MSEWTGPNPLGLILAGHAPYSGQPDVFRCLGVWMPVIFPLSTGFQFPHPHGDVRFQLAGTCEVLEWERA